MPDAGITVKTQQFTAMCAELKQRLGTMSRPMGKVIDYEVARVLEKALANTESADRKKIREHVEGRSKFELEGKTYITKFWGKKQRVPNRIWAMIVAKKQRSLARKLAKVGITKQSFLLLARKLGQDIKAPGYVRQARVEFQRDEVANNVSVIRKGSGNNYGLRIDDVAPLLKWTSGTQAWFAALAGRIAFYHRNVAKGVFDTTASVVKKYKAVIRGPGGA